MKFRYIVGEVYDFYASNGATLTEIDIFDRKGNLISYTATDHYNTGSSKDWNASIWGKKNLNNGKLNYNDNSAGQGTACFFLGGSPNSGLWARFVLDLGKEVEIDTIKLWAGSPEGRTPHEVTFYGCKTYDIAVNINTRNNEGLTLLNKYSFAASIPVVTLFEVTGLSNDSLIIFKKGEQYYYLENNAMILIEEDLSGDLLEDVGVSEVNISKKEIIKQLGEDAEIIVCSLESEKKSVLKTSRAEVYDNFYKHYHGPGMIVTDEETMYSGRKTLVVVADHTDCIFRYRLSETAAWAELELNKQIDIKNIPGDVLRIQVEMPTESAQLRSLSYQWA